MAFGSAGTLFRALEWYVHKTCYDEFRLLKQVFSTGGIPPGRPHRSRLHSSEGEAGYSITTI